MLLSEPVWGSHTNGRDMMCASMSEMNRNYLLWNAVHGLGSIVRGLGRAQGHQFAAGQP